MNNKLFLITIITLFSLSTKSVCQENKMVRYVFEVVSEVSLILPGDVYYENQKFDEILYNDDFEVSIVRYSEGKGYEYFDDLTKYIKEMALQLEYKKYEKYTKKDIKPGVKGQFSITYSEDDEANIIFGVIQDTFTKKLYEIVITCYNINSETAATIVNSLKIK